ncbi:MAG: class I SAM-dependent methyltransferase [Candidatus Pacebacteria bacterium]|nr:class I SAM-dependent methyltransferase [Candidatus Paceibacterota bacterium]
MNTKLNKEKSIKDKNIENQFYNLWEQYSKVCENGLVKIHPLREAAETLEDMLSPCPGGIIHEGGCGDGYWMISHLKKTKANKIIGTDFSEGMLKKAKENIQNSDPSLLNQIELREMDLTKDWPEGNFDAQIFQMFFCYLPFEKWKLILEKASQTTKLGGYIYSSNFVQGCNFIKMYKEHLSEILKINLIFYIPFLIKTRWYTKTTDKWLKDGTIRYPSKEELIDFHKQLGLEIVEIKEIWWGGGITIKAKK